VLQCVAVCCSVLQCAAVCCSVLQHVTYRPRTALKGFLRDTQELLYFIRRPPIRKCLSRIERIHIRKCLHVDRYSYLHVFTYENIHIRTCMCMCMCIHIYARVRIKNCCISSGDCPSENDCYS